MGLRRWLSRAPSDEEIREEIQSHIDQRASHDVTGRAEARRRFGNRLQTEEAVRAIWRGGLFREWIQDLRFTIRTWRRHPAFATAAISALAMGLGMATALFSVVDRILFRQAPYPQPDRIVSVGLMAPLDSNEFLLGPDYLTLWRDPPPPFEETTTFTAGTNPCDLTEAPPERLACLSVEWNFLSFLRVPVIRGRAFTAADGKPGAPLAALITHSLWSRRFASRDDIEGQFLRLDGKDIRIAGVLPPGFELPLWNDADVLLPQQLAPPDPLRPAPMAFLRGFARLKPEVTSAQAHRALQPLFQQMLINVPAAFRKEVTLRVRPLRDRQTADARESAWFLLGAVATLLLIACTTVTNLFIARMAARQRELAVRAALGAGRMRLARLALSECTLLAFIGGAAGLLIAQGLLKALVSIAPDGIPRIAQATVDGRVAAVAFCFALISALLAGIWPALSMPRAESLNVTRVAGGVHPWARFAFVAVQIALTFALLGTAGLMLRSLWNLQATPLGIATDRVAAMSVTLGTARYPAPAQQVTLFDRLLDRAMQMPGTTAAALTDSLPPAGAARGMLYARIQVEGRPLPAEGTGGMVTWRSVTPGYFPALRIPIISGRAFNDDDRRAAEPAMILSEALARRMFPDENPLGRRLRPGSGSGPWHVVVGVARDVRNAGLAVPSAPEYYVARRITPDDAHRQSFLIVRTQASPASATLLLKEAITRLDSELPFRIDTMDDRIARLAARPRFTAWLLTLFAVLALALAAAGLSGIAAYLVEQRQREIAVKMALGATAAIVLRNLLGEAAQWVVGGTLAGAVLAVAANKLVRAFLTGITPADPWAWGAALLALAAALLASVVRPALRAVRIDPAASLRSD